MIWGLEKTGCDCARGHKDMELINKAHKTSKMKLLDEHAITKWEDQNQQSQVQCIFWQKP
jgi:hypothetical protein